MTCSVLEKIINQTVLTGDLKTDIVSLLNTNGCPKTALHCLDVGKEAKRIARLFNANEEAAEIAGWLHDISAVFPSNDRIMVARELGIEILPEEEVFPMIIHQKISRVMAEEIFSISDEGILSAVECHTTLKAQSSLLDRVLFVADKIAWDQAGIPPYIQELNKSLEKSLEHAAFSYIDYLWERKDDLKVVHPWLQEAHEELSLLLRFS